MSNKNKLSQVKIIFGIGSNLGDREKNLKIALEKLANYLSLRKIITSKILKNPALLPPNAPKDWDIEFYNIAVSAIIDIEKFAPKKILEVIKKIEIEIGRNSTHKWSPREIDIDILAIDEIFIEDGNILKIPHYGLFEREFFYKTMQEIEPKLLEKLIKKKNTLKKNTL
ncbi:MAG: 2-amino-4-hydroxy-6-hydroxymethyldihydropteridine diphosphokinase [Proteobacteria bacterium]|nr:2-amino-4-hydroxy-6-hydroxymethyldihydropteridine diphosphokinase [Pseudomonadota bacterium]NCA27669.1 2-amino-4-hydroxy-6-hydroxymethyldihydropteridine diphosphokinase [Pseudomonadota bacterium]